MLSRKQKLCLKCGGACCKILHIPVPPELSEDENVRIFLRTRALALLHDKEGHRLRFIVVPSTCPQLDAKGACRIYASRPKVCQTFDGRKDAFLKDKCLWRILNNTSNLT